MKLKITLKIQSISDLITNSSSETFLRIDTKYKVLHDEIYNALKYLFPSHDWELSPVISGET